MIDIQLPQTKMISQMIIDGETLPSNKSGGFESFVPLTEKQIYQLVSQCATANHLDFEYSNEPLYYIMRDCRIILVSATAGAGKTTLTCFKVDREIRLRGTDANSICMLSFNNDSVASIKDKMVNIMRTNNLVTRRFGIYVDESKYLPNMRSLNSLTYNIVDQYKDYWHISRLDILTFEESISLMSSTLKSISKDRGFLVTEEMLKNCISLYDLTNETLKKPSDMRNASLVLDTGLEPELLDIIMSSYSDRLRILQKFHHSDTTRMILERAEIDEKFKSNLANLYKLIVIDELQDVSESVFRLLKIMVGDHNRLIAIGDSDQSIYGFKGARPATCQQFADSFPDTNQCYLNVNRRCAENILAYAKGVLAEIDTRPYIDLKAIRTGGEVNINHYNDSLQAIHAIAEDLSKVPKEKLGNICIGYRKNVTCYYIAQKLLELGIPFRTRPDMAPGTDKLSQNLRSLFAILKSPTNIKAALAQLYKLTSVRKVRMEKIDEVADAIDDYLDENDLEYFYEVPAEVYGVKGNAQKTTDEELKLLGDLSKSLRKNGKMNDILNQLLPLFKRHYWDFTRGVLNFQPELEDLVIETFNKPVNYVEFLHNQKEMQERINRYVSKGQGVKLSSFHSLKGLEFDEVYLVELDSNNLPLIRISDNMSEEEISELVYEELRLFYVATTRAKNKLHLWWSRQEPSSFESINQTYLNSHAQPQQSNSNVIEEDLTLDLTKEVANDIFEDIPDLGIMDINLSDLDVNLSDLDLTIDEPEEVKPSVTDELVKEHLTKEPQPTLQTEISSEAMEIIDFENENDLTSYHLREDFQDVKNGDELMNILNFICNIKSVGGAGN